MPASTPNVPAESKKKKPRTRWAPSEIPMKEDEFFDEDDLAHLVGVNRRAFHDPDEL